MAIFTSQNLTLLLYEFFFLNSLESLELSRCYNLYVAGSVNAYGAMREIVVVGKWYNTSDLNEFPIQKVHCNKFVYIGVNPGEKEGKSKEPKLLFPKPSPIL